ncbi:MAG: peptidase M52, partial [Acidobacteriota bacterium]
WFKVSSHQLGVVEAIELGRAMKRLPARMSFIGIEGIDFGQGEGLTSAVEDALEIAAAVVKGEVACATSAE